MGNAEPGEGGLGGQQGTKWRTSFTMRCVSPGGEGDSPRLRPYVVLGKEKRLELLLQTSSPSGIHKPPDIRSGEPQSLP